MKLLLTVAAVGIGGYLFFRLCMHLGRPLYLRHAFKELEQQYATLLRLAEGNLEAAIERYNSGKSGNPPLPLTDAEQFKEVESARKARDHEREVNDKFLRLRIRFAHDLEKQAESVAAYRAYLRLRLYREEFASAAAPVGAGAGMSPEERLALHQEQYEEARKIAVAVEESEKKLDALLA